MQNVRFIKTLPLIYLTVIFSIQSCGMTGCVDITDPCYDDCPKGAEGDRCREACDMRPSPSDY